MIMALSKINYKKKYQEIVEYWNEEYSNCEFRNTEKCKIKKNDQGTMTIYGSCNDCKFIHDLIKESL